MLSDSLLLGREFDSSAYLSNVLQFPNFDGEEQRLERCIENVTSQLRGFVVEHHEALLSEVDGLSELEKRVDEVQTAATTLSNSAKRLKITVHDPFVTLNTKVTELRSMMKALEVLRGVQRFVGLVAKMKEVISADVARAARNLREIEEAMAETDIGGVEIADSQLPVVASASSSVRTQALDLLKSTLAGGNQADLGVALQCFFSLGTLSRTIVSLFAEQKREAIKTIVRELDAQTIQKAIDYGDQKKSEGQRTRECVFHSIDATFASLISQLSSLAMLWSTLKKKKDPVTHQNFVDAMDNGFSPLDDLWVSLASQLKEKMSKLAKKGNFHVMLVSEYPTLYSSLRNFCDTVKVAFEVQAHAEGTAQDTWLKDVSCELEQHYVAHSVDKIRDRMNVVLQKLKVSNPATSEVPVADVSLALVPIATANAFDTKPWAKVVLQEIASARHEPCVLGLVLKNCSSALAQLVQKLVEASSRIGPLNVPNATLQAPHLTAASLSNACASIIVELSPVLFAQPPAQNSATLATMRESLKECEQVCQRTLQPFFAALTSAFYKVLDGLCSDYTDEDGTLKATRRIEQLKERCVQIQKAALAMLDPATPALADYWAGLASSVSRKFATIAICFVSYPCSPPRLEMIQKHLVLVSQIALDVFKGPRIDRLLPSLEAIFRVQSIEEILDPKQLKRIVAPLHPLLVLLLCIRWSGKPLATIAKETPRFIDDVTEGTNAERNPSLNSRLTATARKHFPETASDTLKAIFDEASKRLS